MVFQLSIQSNYLQKKKKKKESKYNFGRRSNNENKDIKYIN